MVTNPLQYKHLLSPGCSPTIPRTVIHHLQDGHPPSLVRLPTVTRMLTHQQHRHGNNVVWFCRRKFDPNNVGSKNSPNNSLVEKKLGSKKILDPKILGPKKLIKIGSVAADEIFLIWTNVTRINVAWTNVTITVGPRNLPLKFDQNRVGNRWDIPNKDKWRRDKYCLDKCRCDSCNLFEMDPRS